MRTYVCGTRVYARTPPTCALAHSLYMTSTNSHGHSDSVRLLLAQSLMPFMGFVLHKKHTYVRTYVRILSISHEVQTGFFNSTSKRTTKMPRSGPNVSSFFLCVKSCRCEVLQQTMPFGCNWHPCCRREWQPLLLLRLVLQEREIQRRFLAFCVALCGQTSSRERY